MTRVVLGAASPAVVAQRLTDLLFCFPSAASSGVQWETLLRKYNERFSTSLDIAVLGHSSALAAVTALLWDVLRIVNSEDTDNPVVAIEYSVALTATPGAIATWPSLYKTVCDIVQEYGTFQQDDEAGNDEPAYVMLVSQLKPLLQRHWHAGFDEASLSYLTEEGTLVRLKKMKHLLQALLRFREQRAAFLDAAHNTLDEALTPCLNLLPSKKHNDLLLRCLVPSPAVLKPIAQKRLDAPVERWCDADHDDVSTAASFAGSAVLRQELMQLRDENALLRSQNSLLEKQVAPSISPLLEVKAEQVWSLDDPFEPPPTDYWSFASSSSSSSTMAPSEFCVSSGSGTPESPTSGSGADTPPMISFGTSPSVPQTCLLMPAVMPVWFAMGDIGKIPSGVVQEARAVFEQHAVIPSFFVQH